MATYVYETIPTKPGGKPKHFEIKQSMSEAALTRHPETGEPIRRVVTGGFGVMGTKASPESGGSTHRPSGGSCGCGAGGCRG
ncbi:MAG: zinc ribbon domain-containing protein [Verrucomicrobiales bacterium]|nr:zinc ribbon domain-containing protein [Verrucomicrobiales bacterium]